ncbi:class II glutamine amidotransferase [Nocardia xishanensis]|uniref:class II glutamine amidotransferase n=1 Tax=Nocardia xishanensis TaxID=238964 RepID=UPI000830048B|nr:class II glutamine amidotransferase [Nocardia xishanensis]
MCILTFVKPGITPDLDALSNGAAANPHGHGYAVITGNTITVGHGMDAATVIAEFAQVRAQYPDGPALFHSRLATHGLREIDNCHPFRLGGDERTVLAHNGILPTNVHPHADDPRSDTRIAAEDYLPTQPFGSLDSWAGREHFERWLGRDKIVILTVDPAYKHRAYIFNEHRGHWDAESWYSNTDYRPYQWREAADDCEEYCVNCGEPDYDRLGPHCPWCGFCTECIRTFPKCVCPSLDGEERYADLLELEYT